MLSLYLHTGEHLDNYDDLQEAIDLAIAHWHEDDEPAAYVIRDESVIVATISPVKKDEAVVVYAKFGTIDKFEKIEYVRNAETGKLETHFIRNGVPGSYKF